MKNPVHLRAVEIALGLLTAQQQGHEVVVGEIEQVGQAIMVAVIQAALVASEEALQDEVILQKPAAGPPPQSPGQILRCQTRPDRLLDRLLVRLLHGGIGQHGHQS